jgi:hypothetical protein
VNVLQPAPQGRGRQTRQAAAATTRLSGDLDNSKAGEYESDNKGRGQQPDDKDDDPQSRLRGLP